MNNMRIFQPLMLLQTFLIKDAPKIHTLFPSKSLMNSIFDHSGDYYLEWISSNPFHVISKTRNLRLLEGTGQKFASVSYHIIYTVHQTTLSYSWNLFLPCSLKNFTNKLINRAPIRLQFVCKHVTLSIIVFWKG